MNIENSARVLKRSDLEKSTDAHDFILRNELTGGAVLLIDKPKDWTSFDVANKIRRTFRVKKVGHAGTLDPMATGLLIICTGIKTKEIDSFVGMDKTYTGRIKIGESTPSYDAETEVSERKPFEHVTELMIRDAAASMTGSIEQVPPMYSAIKKNGTPLYKLARRGIEIARKPRPVTIYDFDITEIDLPYVSFRIRCSKGTYIRAIAHDMGMKLDTGGHLTSLRRVGVGMFSVDDAVTIDQLNELKNRLIRKHM